MRNDSFDFKTTRINSGIVLIVPDFGCLQEYEKVIQINIVQKGA